MTKGHKRKTNEVNLVIPQNNKFQILESDVNLDDKSQIDHTSNNFPDDVSGNKKKG